MQLELQPSRRSPTRLSVNPLEHQLGVLHPGRGGWRWRGYGFRLQLEEAAPSGFPGQQLLRLAIRPESTSGPWPFAWLRLSGLELPNGLALVLANGHNGWSKSPLIGKDDHLPPESNPLQRPFGDDDYYEYSKLPGRVHSWSFSYGIFAAKGRGNPLFASCDERHFHTVFEFDLARQSYGIAVEMDGLTLGLDSAPTLEGDGFFALGEWLIPDPDWEGHYAPLWQAVGAWAERLASHDPSVRLPSASRLVSQRCGALPVRGYTSWYYRYTQIDSGWLETNLAALSHEPGWRIFQVDDGYQRRVGDWLTPSSGFPQGMPAFLAAVRRQGLIPGVWLAPFVALEGSELWQRHPDWFLRDGLGNLVLCGDFPHWGGKFYALDTEMPAMRQHLETVLRTMCGQWGAGFIKADFLYAAGRVATGGLTRAARARRAHQWLRDLCAAQDALFLSCGASLSAAFGLCDFARIGADVLGAWEDQNLLAHTSREKCSTYASLVNTVTRSPLNGAFFLNDPDVFILRSNANNLSPAQREVLLQVNQTLGGLVFCSDLLSEYDADQRRQLDDAQRHRDRMGSGLRVIAIDYEPAANAYTLSTSVGSLRIGLNAAPEFRWL